MSKTKIVIIGIIIVIVAIMGYYVITGLSQTYHTNQVLSSEAVANNFIKALKDKKYDEAVSLLSVEGKKKYDVSKLKEYKIPELNFKGKPEEQGDGTVKVTSGDQKTQTFVQVLLTQEEETWKVLEVMRYTLK